MECSNKEYPNLALRLAREYKMLQLILERRVSEKKPNLGKGAERRIIERNLGELEA